VLSWKKTRKNEGKILKQIIIVIVFVVNIKWTLFECWFMTWTTLGLPLFVSFSPWLIPLISCEWWGDWLWKFEKVTIPRINSKDLYHTITSMFSLIILILLLSHIRWTLMARLRESNSCSDDELKLQVIEAIMYNNVALHLWHNLLHVFLLS
jgi:hypothetical protein